VQYETQPLPTPLAWYLTQAPLLFQKVSTALVLVTELALPFLIFGPRRLKQVAAVGTIALQILIFLTGNYCFFNLLTIALCLVLLDDTFFGQKSFARQKSFTRQQRGLPLEAAATNRFVSAALFLFIMTVSATELAGTFGAYVPAGLNALAIAQSPYGLVSEYGLFASMTTTRPEIEIEGSNDGENWKPYLFKYKPGPLTRAPRWVAPFQPRLDWQMWFAALGDYRENPWFVRLLVRLLEGSQPVLALMENPPFEEKPPKHVRAMVYEYRFTTFGERRKTGNWWKREFKGAYFPTVSLR
jgi:hypothetical protein